METFLQERISPSASVEAERYLDLSSLWEGLNDIFPSKAGFTTPWEETACLYESLRSHGLPVRPCGRAHVLHEETHLVLGIGMGETTLSARSTDAWVGFEAWYASHHDTLPAWVDQPVSEEELGGHLALTRPEYLPYQPQVDALVGTLLRQRQHETLDQGTGAAEGRSGRARL